MSGKEDAERKEWIGKQMRVVSASNQSLEGIKGAIVDETKFLLVVETEKGKKRVPKIGSVFEIVIEDKAHVIKGDEVAVAPEERIKFKVKK